jgi:hypothetical protein
MKRQILLTSLMCIFFHSHSQSVFNDSKALLDYYASPDSTKRNRTKVLQIIAKYTNHPDKQFTIEELLGRLESNPYLYAIVSDIRTDVMSKVD